MSESGMAEIEWTNESVARLLEEYRRRRELWDKDDNLYRSSVAKYESWAAMARAFQCEIADLRKKVNSILASYRRERAKIRSGGVSTWFLYDSFNFLPSHLENPKIAKTSYQMPEERDEADDQTSDDQDLEEYDNDVIVKQEPVVEYVRAESLPPIKSSKRLKRTIRRRVIRDPVIAKPSTQIDGKLLEVLRLLRKTSEVKKKDECDTFGEYIAVSLRKHNDRTQSMIKQAINNILFEQEMKKYGGTQFGAEVEENPLILGEAESVTS